MQADESLAPPQQAEDKYLAQRWNIDVKRGLRSAEQCDSPQRSRKQKSIRLSAVSSVKGSQRHHYQK